jgi:enamine deaminase RidA (YjgF/YER057c/UK114 family)
MTPDEKFSTVARELGHSFDGEIRIGGNYTSVVEDGGTLYVSGQIPRVGYTLVVTGRVGHDVTLEDARLAAKICVMRGLALLRQTLGSLARIKRVLRITVYVQSALDFTQLSEVSDGASDLLFEILGDAGVHSRTSVGVQSLPKNAPVELDMIVSSL